jgi:deazaflavin-dependent oxidoreductase (nitroreductase family)
MSRSIARFNVRGTNRVTRPFAGRLPGFGVVRHVARTSGTPYETPVNLFRDGDRYVVALTYGSDSQWVKNVLAAGRCAVRTGGKTVEVADPTVFRDPERKAVPAGVRAVLRALDVDEFMSLTPVR